MPPACGMAVSLRPARYPGGSSGVSGGETAARSIGLRHLLAPPGGTGAHPRRDIRAILADRHAMLGRRTRYPEDRGIASVWLEPRDGA